MYKYTLSSLGILSIGLSITPVYASTPRPVEKTVDILYKNIDFKSSVNVDNTPKVNIHLGVGIDANINQALVYKDWKTLKKLLKDYPQHPDFDEILYDYALGMLYRSQQKHRQAIQIYQKLLKKHPEFHYVRFDAGVMAFENKQYRQAQKYIAQSKKYLHPNLQPLAEQYLREIIRRERIQPKMTLNYEQNNNVNNASSAQEIHWQGKTWKKSQESLPQQATGVRYGLGAERDINIDGNHFMTGAVEADGVHYWDNPSYNEQRIHAKLGYKYQDIKQSISLLPFSEHQWSDHHLQSHEVGLSMAWSRALSAKTRINTSVTRSTRHYAEQRLADRYDSHTSMGQAMLSYAIKPNIVLFGGLDASRENAKDDEYSYKRVGANIGVMAEKPKSVGGRVSVRVAQRKYQQEERLVYDLKRKDDEYHIQAMLWHNQVHFKGFQPQLNVRYQRIDSNMDSFYSRDNLQTFINVEKRF